MGVGYNGVTYHWNGFAYPTYGVENWSVGHLPLPTFGAPEIASANEHGVSGMVKCKLGIHSHLQIPHTHAGICPTCSQSTTHLQDMTERCVYCGEEAPVKQLREGEREIVEGLMPKCELIRPNASDIRKYGRSNG